MKKTTKQEKQFRLGRKRQSFGAVFAEKFIPAVAVGTALCIITGFILYELLIGIYQETNLAHFHMLVNSVNQNMNTMTYEDNVQTDSYKNMMAFQLYLSSGYGTGSCVYKLYQKDKEAVRTERSGVALVHGDNGDALCYADLSCYTEAYERVSKYNSKAGLFSADSYIITADTIYADTEKGIFVPGRMTIEHYSYDRFGTPPAIETVEEFDITPADTTGLTEYQYGQFTGGTVFGVEADDNIFNILDRRDSEESKNGLISAATVNTIFWNDAPNASQGWFKSDLYAPDGVQYTVTALYKTDCLPVFTNIMILICGVVLLICIAASLIRAAHTYNVYKAHYAMDDYRRDMTNTLAHDLKTPLTAISGCAEMLNNDADTDKQKKYSEMILSNVEYMNGIISNVLELSKLEGGSEPKKEHIDAASLAREVVSKNAPLSEDRGISFTVSGSGEINADRQLMTQVLDNLISNAVKFSPDNSKVTIKVSDSELSVSNPYSAKGDIQAEKLWQPFVKGDSSRSGQNGSGLGLYIVKNICDRHGFGYSIDTEGGRFTVKIAF